MDTFFIFAARYFIILPAVILGIYFLTRKWPAQKQMVLFAIPAGLLACAFGLLGGHFFFDPRPFVVGHFMPLISHAPDNGFPSDHTLLASAFAAVGMFWNKWLGLALWLIAIVIAVARVYVGVHHPLDVVASMVFAIIATFVWYGVLKYAQRV
ncbi:MAG: phosphatase PAP2 family protein [Minisyncoccia bacterium]